MAGRRYSKLDIRRVHDGVERVSNADVMEWTVQAITPPCSAWAGVIDTGHVHFATSISCASSKPNRLLETSAASGWTSLLLLDHHQGVRDSEIFETHPTDDLTLVVDIAGRHRIQAFSRGRWNAALYQPGNIGMTPPGETARLRWQTASASQAFRTMNAYLPSSLIRRANS